MKRTISLVLAILMVFTVLTACDTQKPTESTDNQSSQSSSIDEPAWKTEQVNLVMWDYPAEGPSKARTLGKFAQFEVDYPNIKVEHKLFQPESGQDRVEFTTAMTAGTGPDLYTGAHFVVIKDWIQQGFTYPMDEYLKDWERTPFLREGLMEMAKDDAGAIHGIPLFATPFTLAIRTDRFIAAGLDPAKPPKTWDEYVQCAVALTDRNKGQYGISLLGDVTADWWFQFYVWQAGGEITTVDSDGKVSLHITEDPAVEALQFYKDLVWKYDVAQKDITMGFGDLATEFALGKSAMSIFAVEWLPWWQSLGMKNEEMTIVPLPAGPSGKNTASISGAFAIMNPNTSKERRDATWEYFKYMYGKDSEIQKLNDLQTANTTYPIVTMYSDVNPADYMDVDPSWVEIQDNATVNGREEYYLVEQIRPYLIKAIQSVLVDKNQDPKAAMEAAAVAIQKEVIDPYNNAQ